MNIRNNLGPRIELRGTSALAGNNGINNFLDEYKEHIVTKRDFCLPEILLFSLEIMALGSSLIKIRNRLCPRIET